MTEQKRRRRQQNGGELTGKDILNTLKENIYGGNKMGRRARCELPADPIGEGATGIKVRFGKLSEKYPSEIELRMTDGEWVKYRIDVGLPEFKAAMDILNNRNWETGYPPKKS